MRQKRLRTVRQYREQEPLFLSDLDTVQEVTSGNNRPSGWYGINGSILIWEAQWLQAVWTIEAQFTWTSQIWFASYYDLIVTGDLGHVDAKLLYDLLHKHANESNDAKQFQDCGISFIEKDKPVIAGC